MSKADQQLIMAANEQLEIIYLNRADRHIALQLAGNYRRLAAQAKKHKHYQRFYQLACFWRLQYQKLQQTCFKKQTMSSVYL